VYTSSFVLKEILCFDYSIYLSILIKKYGNHPKDVDREIKVEETSCNDKRQTTQDVHNIDVVPAVRNMTAVEEVKCIR